MYLSVLRLKRVAAIVSATTRRSRSGKPTWSRSARSQRGSTRACAKKKPGGFFVLLFPRSLALFALLFASILACGQTLTIVSPKSGATVSSPVRLVANFSSTAPIETISVLLDGVQVAQPDAVTPLDIDVPMSAGNHLLTVNAVQSDGVQLSDSRNV